MTDQIVEGPDEDAIVITLAIPKQYHDVIRRYAEHKQQSVELTAREFVLWKLSM